MNLRVRFVAEKGKDEGRQSMNSIEKILFPINFLDLSFQSIERLYPFKGAGLKEIILLFVIDRDEVGFNLVKGFDYKLTDQMHEEAYLRFQDWANQIQKTGLRTRGIVEIGTPEVKILEVAFREKVDLIVSGRRRRRAADRVYLGGAAMEVLRRTTIPVFICKNPLTQREITDLDHENHPYERILFATDFSEHSEGAQRFLTSIKGAVLCVDVVHVASKRDFQNYSPEEIRQVEEEAKAKLDAICEGLRNQGMDSEPHLVAGHTAVKILRAGLDYRSTMILMATKGKHGIAEMWLGSVSHRVAELSKISVLLVPQRKEEGQYV